MGYFRQIAFPTSFLAFLWLKAFDETGIFERHIPVSSAWFWTWTTIELLLIGLLTAGMIWGANADYQANKHVKTDPTKARRVWVLMSLLTASSIPNLLILVVVADQLNLAFREVRDLGFAIFATPLFLGIIWLRLQELACENIASADIGRASQE